MSRNEMQDELDRLRGERTALDQLMSKMIGLEAAIRVLVRHGLAEEFAREVAALSNEPRE